jgi:hypothetical protein
MVRQGLRAVLDAYPDAVEQLYDVMQEAVKKGREHANL